jgi:hypothetical protein
MGEGYDYWNALTDVEHDEDGLSKGGKGGDGDDEEAISSIGTSLGHAEIGNAQGEFEAGDAPEIKGTGSVTGEGICFPGLGRANGDGKSEAISSLNDDRSAVDATGELEEDVRRLDTYMICVHACIREYVPWSPA